MRQKLGRSITALRVRFMIYHLTLYTLISLIRLYAAYNGRDTVLIVEAPHILHIKAAWQLLI